ncbi:MAG: ABC transporter substrate-binding protein [Acetobacteraceae bacterium]
MESRVTRRSVLWTTGAAAASIGLGGALRPTVARAEDSFTYSIVGGSFGRGEIKAFITDPQFEEKNHVHITYEYAQDNIRAAKTIASCHNPIFSVVDAQPLQADLLADGGCIRGYDLDIVTNYKDLVELATEPPRNGIENFFGSMDIMALALTYNSKAIPEPHSFQDLLSPKLKGRVAIPAFDWMGPQFLYGVNWALGGTSGNLDEGFKFIAELVKKNNAIVLDNSDSADQAFTREEIVAMPFWNGRTNILSKNGLPVKLSYPKGWVPTGSGIVITRGTKFPRLANLLVNNFLAPENQIKITSGFGYPPSNRKAKLPSEMADWKVPESTFKDAARLNYGIVTANMAKNLERWNKEVLG